MYHLKGLNEAQKKAVLHTEGPLLIVAGAGAGKTKTITHRILNLIHKGVNPEAILAITFTNKAAKEMRERTLNLLTSSRSGISAGFPHYESPCIKTFHALGVQILKEEARTVGLTKHFAILDAGESSSLIKESIVEAGHNIKQFEPRRLKNLISRQKSDFITVDTFTEKAEGYFPKILADIWARYEKKLKSSGALDFDDLILKTVTLLKENPLIRKKYQILFQYVHIDEYQDTNAAQYEFSKLLVGEKKNICVVGDSDQNIYSWRGANIKNILNFEKDYPGAMVVTLEENYRSTKNILEAANKVIKKNTERIDKTLFTNNKTGEKIGLFEAFDENDEADFVSEKIKTLAQAGIPHDLIAVLYRTNFQSRVFEEALFGKVIPYQVLGTKFFERKEVKDVISYVRLALNRDSLTDLKRIINVPPRGIGKVGLAKILSGNEETLSAGTKEKIKKWREFMQKIEEQSKLATPSLLVKYVVKNSGLEESLENGTEEDKERLLNIYELATLASRYDALPKGEGLERFLEDAALFSDQDSLSEEGGVKLLTAHAAKGLEFSHVFIVGLEQDLFPHAQRGGGPGEKEDDEEERRLFYVALTRAEKKLYLSYASMRTIFGSRQINAPSEFIFDIPPGLLEQERREAGGKIVYL
ncbi:MAG: UvrD-helicase domain-containing protein [Patescibacteria group bacterium]